MMLTQEHTQNLFTNEDLFTNGTLTCNRKFKYIFILRITLSFKSPELKLGHKESWVFGQLSVFFL